MKNIFAVFIVISVSVLFISCGKDDPPDPRANDYVYVCSSNSAKTYHTMRDCSALKNCSSDILEVTRHKAQENERIICSNCNKKEQQMNSGDTTKK